MTTNQSQTELRKQVEVHVKDAMGDFPTPHLLEWHTDIFMQLITADRKRVALEARIDEAKHIAQLFVGLPTKTMKRADLKYYLISRIAELKAQQEEV